MSGFSSVNPEKIDVFMTDVLPVKLSKVYLPVGMLILFMMIM
jgi:hypothetical protein